jgi:nitrous oxidase accessory protein
MKTLLTIITIFFFVSASSKEIVVGSGQLITTLRTAVSIANDKDTILLNAGVYREGNIAITKSISVIGIGNPVLDGENKYEILTVSEKYYHQWNHISKPAILP